MSYHTELYLRIFYIKTSKQIYIYTGKCNSPKPK